MAIEKGQYKQAAHLLGAAKEAREQMNALSKDPQEIEELALAMEQLAKVIGESNRNETMAEGQQMDLDEAVEIALKGSS